MIAGVLVMHLTPTKMSSIFVHCCMIYVARNTLAAVKSKYIYTQPVMVSGNRFARRYGHWPAELGSQSTVDSETVIPQRRRRQQRWIGDDADSRRRTRGWANLVHRSRFSDTASVLQRHGVRVVPMGRER